MYSVYSSCHVIQSEQFDWFVPSKHSGKVELALDQHFSGCLADFVENNRCSAACGIFRLFKKISLTPNQVFTFTLTSFHFLRNKKRLPHRGLPDRWFHRSQWLPLQRCGSVHSRYVRLEVRLQGESHHQGNESCKEGCHWRSQVCQFYPTYNSTLHLHTYLYTL